MKFIFLMLVFVLGIIVGVISDVSFKHINTLDSCGGFPDSVMIPDDEMVTGFCQHLGYRYGWLSGSCGVDEVMCHRKVGAYDSNVCEKWLVVVR